MKHDVISKEAKTRLPPIIFPRPEVKWSYVRQLFLQHEIKDYEGVIARDKITVKFTSATLRNKALAVLMREVAQFSTYRVKKETPLKVVIRSLDADSPALDLKAELETEGFPVITITQFTRKFEGEQFSSFLKPEMMREEKSTKKKRLRICESLFVNLEETDSELCATNVRDTDICLQQRASMYEANAND